jgi:hypothetical protein
MVRPFDGTARWSRLPAQLLSIVHCGSAVVGFTAAWAMFGPVAVLCAVMISGVSVALVWGIRLPGVRLPTYRAAVVSGVVVMSSLGILVAFHLWGLLWVTALGATASPVRARLRRSRHRADRGFAPFGFTPQGKGNASTSSEPRGQAVPLPRLPVLREVSELDLDGLCLMWHRTYFQLLDPVSTLHTATLVDYRQRLLDEMDHRAPSGLQRWLISGPRPSTNPRPFLQSCTDGRESGDVNEGRSP